MLNRYVKAILICLVATGVSVIEIQAETKTAVIDISGPAVKIKAQEEAIEKAEEKMKTEAGQEGEVSAPVNIDEIRYMPARHTREVPTEVSKEEEAGPFLPSTIDSYVRYMPSRHTKGTSGEVSIVDTETEYSYDLKAFGKLPVTFSVDTHYIGIDNTNEVKLPASLTSVAVGIETTFPIFKLDKTYLRVGASPSFYGYEWNFNSSTFRMPFYSFAIYQPNDKWTFIAGVAVFPDFETKVFPIGGFIYKPNDRLIFNITPERPDISYLLNKRLTLFLEGDASGPEFAVQVDNGRNLTLAYNEMHLGGGARWQLNKYLEGSLSVGRIFSRSLKYRDSQGKVTIKNGLYTEFRLEADF